MTTFAAPAIATASISPDGKLRAASDLIADVQRSCGGVVGGPLALPALLELAGKAQALGLTLSRPFVLSTPFARIRGWGEFVPTDDGSCDITVVSWFGGPSAGPHAAPSVDRVRREVRQHLPELIVHLDAEQRILAVTCDAPDLDAVAATLAARIGQHWADSLVPHVAAEERGDWRLFDGIPVLAPGSPRDWSAWLEPNDPAQSPRAGFVLTLCSDTAYQVPTADIAHGLGPREVAEQLLPSFREPARRILETAESIHARLEGPLAEVYVGYAADMVEGGEHLLSLVENFTDPDQPDENFANPSLETIDLAAVARNAVAILRARAAERGIVLSAPAADEGLAALGEPRRALQILINLIGNAIAYSPRDSQVWVRLDQEDDRAHVTVADQGHGLNAVEQAMVFDRFERLGRQGNGGSGLGLYISRRFAREMKGTLSVESAPGQGARFTLSLASGSGTAS